MSEPRCPALSTQQFNLLNDERLIGVIDLKSGQAVRAVGGHRHLYQPVESFKDIGRPRQTVQGNPHRLSQCYQHSGVNNLYLADLDSLTGGSVQYEPIHRIVNEFPKTEFLIDIGLRSCMVNEVPAPLSDLMLCQNVSLVLATESADKSSMIQQCIHRWNADRLVISLDFRNGRFLSNSQSQQEWIDSCINQKIQKVIALDLAAVGTGNLGLTLQLCKMLRQTLPETRLITGGGVRDTQDVKRLQNAGADQVLAASLFVQ